MFKILSIAVGSIAQPSSSLHFLIISRIKKSIFLKRVRVGVRNLRFHTFIWKIGDNYKVIYVH